MLEAMAMQLYTAEELLEFGEDYELDEGVLLPVTPACPVHGEICSEISGQLWTFVKRHRLGKVFCNDVGFHLESNPDTVRGPDVAFVSTARTGGMPRTGFWKTHPDLAVEVISPSDLAGRLQKKIGQFLERGCPLVWAIYPNKRQVVVYEADGSVVVLGAGDTLRGGTVLPGFELGVDDLFNCLD